MMDDDISPKKTRSECHYGQINMQIRLNASMRNRTKRWKHADSIHTKQHKDK